MSENSKLTADDLLRLYFETPPGKTCAKILDLLIEKHALPVIEKSLKKKFRESENNGFFLSEQDFEDLRNESCWMLIKKLAEIRESADRVAIRDFERYVSVIAFNCWNAFFNKRAPNWKSLKNKIRYSVEKNDEIEIWREKNESFCGLRRNNRKIGEAGPDQLVELIEREVVDFRNADLPDLLFEILEKAEAALGLNMLVSITARLWAIDDLPEVSLESFRNEDFLNKRTEPNVFEMRFELEHIWQEIRVLPVNQRIALLLNLRDERGREMLFMFYNAKIASMKEICAALDLSLEEFASLLPMLPLGDKAIAERMKLTAKKVSNLRKVARENLRRRLDGKPKRKSFKDQRKPEENDSNNETEGNSFDPAFGES